MPIFGQEQEIKSLGKLLARIKGRVYHKLCDLDITVYASKEPLTYENRFSGEERKISVGEKWGDLFDCAWFHFTGTIPETAEEKDLAYIIDVNGEGLIVDKEGAPYRGITNVNSYFGSDHCSPVKRVVRITEPKKAGDAIDFWMDAGCNDLLGYYRSGTVKEAYLAECNYKIRELYYDVFVLFDLLKNTSDSEPVYYELLSGLLKVRNTLTDFKQAELLKCFEITKMLLAKKNGDTAVNVTAIGNAHIDLAWLWPIRETKRKGARTFATALDNMNRYDSYIFGGSQAQLYDWIKQDYPKLYEKVAERVKEGRFELMGSMWVESDTNIPSGESLIRQIMYGNAFYAKEFGKTCNYVWLPDTFGYSGALPQIIKGCGMDAFLTTKISWNKYTSFPYCSFIWRGIDGTDIPTHMPPEGNYVSAGDPTSLRETERRLAKSGQFGDVLMAYGVGDGGGGPAPSHIEILSREENLRGLPPTETGTVKEFLDKFLKTAEALPVYNGELYLECHTATYTTMGKNKYFNRLCEQKLRNAEMLSAVAMRLGEYAYPQQKLTDIWKEVLLYQFHDILPGSSINRVYEEAQARYAVIIKELDALIASAAEDICGKIDTSGIKNPLVVFNTQSFERSVWVKTDSGYKKVTVPPMGYNVISADSSDACGSSFNGMENEYLRVEFADNGDIASVYNKRLGKELLSGAGGALLIYDDIGDAWEMEHEYLDKTPEHAELISSEFFREGPFARTVQKYRYKRSAFEVTITLADGSDRLEFNMNADWNEDGRMLRIRFEHTVKTDSVNCNIQFGHINRSAHSNNEYEKAQYEICAHRWIRAAQPKLGVSLLSECKYGFFAKENVIEMAALRASNHPSRHMEAGKHSFSYALFADNGENDFVTVNRAANDFTDPVIVCRTDSHKAALQASQSFVSVNSDGILIDTVKKAEQSDDIIVRSYEINGISASAEFTFGFKHNKPALCGLAEQDKREIGGDTVYHGFEIKTICI
ncbi:MAG TPA: alpha-mannosidase [Ruminococcaceae bacterium]|nr:alpha-mannosidase [Oscillospiraceae bacterium]